MPVTIHISGESAGESLVELRALAAGLSGAAPAAETKEAPKQDKPARSRSTTKPELVKEETPAETESEPVATADPESEPEEKDESDAADIPTVVTLRAKAQEVGTTPEAKKKIKELLDKYGSKNITEMPEEHRAAFLKELEELA